MHVISVQGSQTQKSKLRNGHKVRVKHGAGFNVVVSPNTYHIVSRAFMKNKGISLQLSPEELAMNRAPSPEMQQQIMGHSNHMVIPGVIDHINKQGKGLGTGVGDWFKNLGHQIKSKVIDPVQQKVFDPINQAVYKPIERAVIDPIKQQYEKHVPESVRRDISTYGKIVSPEYLLRDAIGKFKEGKNPREIMKQYNEDLRHLNNTKNTIIRKSPALTEAYKKGVVGLTTAQGTAFGATLNPALAPVGGYAGKRFGEEILKREGYGIHHFIDHGLKKMKKSMMKHFSPIEGGAITLGHVKDFFKNAGKKVKDFATQNIIKPAERVAVKGHQMSSRLHKLILDNPELGKKIKQHGSKLAGLLAKEGIKYFGGDEDMQNLAGDVGKELGEAGFKEVGYGEEKPKPDYTPQKTSTPVYTTVPKQNSPLNHNTDAYEMAKMEIAKKKSMGQGLYAGRQGRGTAPATMNNFHTKINNARQTANASLGRGMEPPSRLIGAGFNSYDSMHKAAMGYSDANALLGKLSDMTFRGMHYNDPIKKYWDGDGQPPSRGTGLHKNHHGKVHHRRKTGFESHNHYNLVRGKGTLMDHKSSLPPALQSQPYGANFHMHNMLPPQYQKYNDGTNEY